MSLYSEISKILPYLQSVRTLEKYFSIDINFPKKWKLPKTYVDENKVVEHATKEPNKRFFSFVSELSEKDLNIVIDNIENIIDYNIEREEKENLFKSKIEDLKKVFETGNLEDLRYLSFEMPPNELEPEDEYTLDDNEYEEQGESDRLVSEGTEEG